MKVKVVRFPSPSRTTRRFSSPAGVARAETDFRSASARGVRDEVDEAVPGGFRHGREAIEDLGGGLEEEEREARLLGRGEGLQDDLLVHARRTAGPPGRRTCRPSLPARRSRTGATPEPGSSASRFRGSRRGSRTGRSSGRTSSRTRASPCRRSRSPGGAPGRRASAAVAGGVAAKSPAGRGRGQEAGARGRLSHRFCMPVPCRSFSAGSGAGR